MNIYREIQINKNNQLIKDGFFNGDKGNGLYNGEMKYYVLQDYKNNFYPPIVDEVQEYFKNNNIKWWNEDINVNQPTANTL